MNFDATKKIKHCYTRTIAKKKLVVTQEPTIQKKMLQSNVLYFAKNKISRSKVWNESI